MNPRCVLVYCDGCGEVWEAAPGMVGALCGKGQVRVATASEAESYYTVEGEPYEDTYFPGIADYDMFGRPSWET